MQKLANSNLHDAKKNKKDEFYTQLSDIENGLKHILKIKSCIATAMTRYKVPFLNTCSKISNDLI